MCGNNNNNNNVATFTTVSIQLEGWKVGKLVGKHAPFSYLDVIPAKLLQNRLKLGLRVYLSK